MIRYSIISPLSGKLIHEHLWDRRTEPLSVRWGRRSHEERIEAKHTSSLPSFGALRRDNTPTAACLTMLSCVLALERAWSLSGLQKSRSDRTSQPPEPPLRCAWASFYTLKGSPTGGNAEEGKNVKSEVVDTVACTVHPT